MPHDQRYALERSHTFSSSTHSTATSPDVVGPGRTLGLLFDWLGKGLESLLNKRASQLNLGPEAVSRDIRRIRRHHEINAFVRFVAPYAHLTTTQDKKIKKLCKKLLKYTRSHVRSTQLKALDEIVTLSTEDQIVREALFKCGARCLLPNYKEAELSFSISKAIQFVENSETHALWNRLQFMVYSHDLADHFSGEIADLDEPLKGSLSDPRSSFIAARYLAKIFYSFPRRYQLVHKQILTLFGHYMDLIATSSDIIEWSNVNSSGWIMRFWEDHCGDRFRPDIVKCLIRNSRNLTKLFEELLVTTVMEFCTNGPGDETGEPFSYVIVERWDQTKLRSFNTIVVPIVDDYWILGRFLEVITDTEDYQGHLLFLQTRDSQTRKLLKDILVGNEILVIFRQIVNHIKATGPVYQRCKCLALHQEDDATQMGTTTTKHRPDCLLHAIDLLDHYCNADQVVDRALSRFLMETIASASRYYKLALYRNSTPPLYLSRETSLKRDFFDFKLRNSFPAVKVGQLNVVWRMRIGGKYFFFDDRMILSREVHIPGNVQSERVDRVDVTLLPTETVVLTTRPHIKEPFNSTSHYPIVAFLDDSGEPSYLAIARIGDPEKVRADRVRRVFTAVKEGDSTATWYNDYGRPYVTHNFLVVSLRHDPIDFPIGQKDDPWRHFRPRTGSLDPTCPIYWLPYFPKKNTDFFEDIEQKEFRVIDELISLQNGGYTPMRPHRPIPSNVYWLEDHFVNDDGTESDVSSPEIEATKYSCSEDPESSKSEAPCAKIRVSDGSDDQRSPDVSADSADQWDIADDEERRVEGGENAGPVRGDDAIDHLQRTIEEKDKEIAMLQSMLRLEEQ